MSSKTNRRPSGRPISDLKPDILFRVVRKHISEKRRDPRSIIPLYQVELANEIGTTRETLSKAFEQYVGKDLKLLDPSFEGLKIVKAPSVYVLDDDLGELLLARYELGGKGITMGLCTSCGEWTQTSIPAPEKIACDACGLVYKRTNDKNLNLNSTREPKQKRSTSEILRLIEALEDEKLDQDIRKKDEFNLWKCCAPDSEIVGGKTDLGSFFIRALDNFEPKKGIVLDHIHHTLERYVAFQLKGDEDILWMKEMCYPKLLSLFDESDSIKIRHRILMILSEIYGIDELYIEQGKLTMILRKRFFAPKEEDSIAIRCWEMFLSQADDKLKETLKDEIFNLAKSWDTFWSRADDELKEILEGMVSNITSSEKEILRKRGLEVRKEHYGI